MRRPACPASTGGVALGQEPAHPGLDNRSVLMHALGMQTAPNIRAGVEAASVSPRYSLGREGGARLAASRRKQVRRVRNTIGQVILALPQRTAAGIAGNASSAASRSPSTIPQETERCLEALRLDPGGRYASLAQTHRLNKPSQSVQQGSTSHGHPKEMRD